MGKDIYGIFVAGGRGVRMGGDVPKQFLEVGGKTVLQRTIESFTEAIPGIKVITVLPESGIETWKQICEKYSFDCPQRIVKGGFTRFHSVRNALEHVPDGALVMIQDGVRPFCSRDLLRRLLDALEEHRAVCPCTPVTDSLKSTDHALPDPDRSKLVAVQTPQCFRSEDIREAYRQAYDTAFTDDASVAAKKGIPVTLIQGDRYNIKITTPEDLELARLLTGR